MVYLLASNDQAWNQAGLVRQVCVFLTDIKAIRYHDLIDLRCVCGEEINCFHGGIILSRDAEIQL